MIVVKVGQILLDIAMTAYPTFLRNFGGIGLGVVNLVQIAYALYSTRLCISLSRPLRGRATALLSLDLSLSKGAAAV